MAKTGVIYGINGPVVSLAGDPGFQMNEMVYVGKENLVGEVIGLTSEKTTIQVYEETSGLKPGEVVTGTGAPVSVTLAPGILDNIFDGIERPLSKIAERSGYYISRGISVDSLDTSKKWKTHMTVKKGDRLLPGTIIAEVPETRAIVHKVMVPPDTEGYVLDVVEDGEYTINEPLLTLQLLDGTEKKLTMTQKWPIRVPRPSAKRYPATRPLITGQRILDTLFPIAKGGVAAVLDKSHDNFKLHIADTLIAGKYKNNLAAIEVLVSEGPQDVLKLKEMGVAFDLDASGKMMMTLEAGHSRHRIVHHKDSTGRAIVDALIEKVKEHKNVDILENTLLYSLEKADNGFFAGLILDNGEQAFVGAKYCIMASGGIGRVYQYTTNSAIATGDGITLAHMLGARIKHLSWIQFHPTAFAAEADRERFLISEAVRGEGAILLNHDGRRFMFDYDERGELAPRDVVSHAIMEEQKKTGSSNFYLDITAKDPEFVKNRFQINKIFKVVQGTVEERKEL